MLRAPGWQPTGPLGDAYGQNAATYASEAELPAGVNLWLDLEGVANGTAHQDIIDYANNWFAAVGTAGYVPGVYIGFNVWLSPDEIYWNLSTKHYWRAGGNIPDVSQRDYQLLQYIENPGQQNEFDRDVTQNDAFGDSVFWITRNQLLIA